MHRSTLEEKTEQERQDNIYELARKEKQTAIDARTFYKFFYAHRADGINFQANEGILRKFLIEQELPITLENLELAYLAEGHRLCSRAEPYIRQTNSQESRFMAQRPALNPVPEVVLPYSADEIRSMPAEQLKRLMRKPEYLKEINRILAVKVR